MNLGDQSFALHRAIMLPSGSFDGSQPVTPGLVGTQLVRPGPGASFITGASDAVAINVPEPHEGGEIMDVLAAAPLALDAGLSRLVDRYFGPGAVARGMQIILHHSGLLSIAAVREQITGIPDENFYPIFNKVAENIGLSSSLSGEVVQGLARLRGLAQSRLVERVSVGSLHRQDGPLLVHNPRVATTFPHRLNATVLAGTATGARVLAEARSVRVKIESGEDTSRVESSQGSVSTVSSQSRKGLFTHSRKRARVPPEGSVREAVTISNCEEQAYVVAELFSDVSDTFRFCASAAYERKAVVKFITQSLRNRCKTDRTLARITSFIKGFYDFTTSRDPPLPFHGKECLLAVTEWLSMLQIRGDSIPGMGRYALRVFGEALGVVFPIDHPAVRGLACRKTRKTKTAPMLKTEFLFALEKLACDKAAEPSDRLYSALFTLLALASLRFGDTKQTAELRSTGSCITGCGIDQKNKSSEFLSWATPLKGVTGSTAWAEPILKFWESTKPVRGAETLHFLFPHIDGGGRIVGSRAASFGLVQARLTKLELKLGFDKSARVHSFRGWAPTCASQLRFSREDREKLGHWAPGSIMPERYDKAECATELRLREGILEKIRTGWRPSGAFELPTEVKAGATPSSSESETSSTSIHDPREENIAELDFVPPPRFEDFV